METSKESALVSTNDENIMSEVNNNLSILKEFLTQNYEFRNNILSDQLEFRPRREEQVAFRPLTTEAENSIILRASLELEEVKNVRTGIQLIIHSEETPAHDPILQYMSDLPEWDGQNRVAELFGRLPGITSEQILQCSIWFRSAVAHWLRRDPLHGNETVPTLIGEQGCGKTVFCRRLLPPELQAYFMDHLNLSNKFDKDMAFSNNLIVVLDELEQYTLSQQAVLKQALSKSTVNGRPIFGRAQKDRHRYASFLATTNNPHPLNDPTGSRRYVCIRLAPGVLINNDLPIDYPQLYAQLLNEVCERKLRHWFMPDENLRIQEANLPFQQVLDVDEMVHICFRKPQKGEAAQEYSIPQIMSFITRQFPLMPVTHGLKVRVGNALKSQGFQHRQHNTGSFYVLVPKPVA